MSAATADIETVIRIGGIKSMARLNFSLRHMFLAITFVAIMLGVAVWVAKSSPEMFIYAFVLSCPMGLFGMVLIAVAWVMLLSVYASSDSAERSLNIAKFKNLALIGALMLALPILAAFATFVLLPMIQPE